MPRYIDADKTIEALRRAEALTRAFGYHNVIETVREMPTADAVEVVRCKDCKWFRIDNNELWCGHTDGMCIEELAFCSDGERRHDAEIH